MASIIFYKVPSLDYTQFYSPFDYDPIYAAWWPDSSGIKTYTWKTIDEAVAYRDSILEQLFLQLQDLNADLENLDFPELTAEMGTPSESIPPIGTLPTSPTAPTFPTDFPAPPAAIDVGTVNPITIDNPPTLTAEQPVIDDVVPPDPFTELAPTGPTVPDRSTPLPPDYVLPVVPTLRDLLLPDAPIIIDLNFEGTLPEDLGPPPDVDFSFTEAEYQSILNDAMRDRLLELVLNVRQTGLSEAVQAQIWGVARERTAAEAQRRIDTVTRRFAGAGWMMPQGDEAMLIKMAEDAAITDDITESRNIAIETARLEQANFQFAFTNALQLESQWMTLHNNTQQRAFEAAKYAVQAAIDLYQIRVSYFNAGIALYTAQADVYGRRIQAELAKVEIYKAQLEGQKLIGELNKLDVDIYKTQIDAVVALFELYKAELEGVKVNLQNDGLKIQNFEAEIRAYAEKIRAKSLEYDGYKAQLEGENIKATIYNSLVNAFKAEVDAYVGTAEVKLKQLDSEIKVNLEVPLETMKANTEIYKAQMEGKVSQIESIAKVYETQGDVYKSQAETVGIIQTVYIEKYKAELDFLYKDLQAKINIFEANLRSAVAESTLLIETQKSETQLKAQIAAAIGGAVNFSTSLSGSSAYNNAEPRVIAI